MDIRRFLYSCRGAVFEIRSLERQRDSVRVPMGPRDRSTSVIELTSRDNDPTSTGLNNIDYYDELLREKIDEQKQKLTQFENMVSALDDETTRAIMRYYFAQGWTNARIADELEIAENTAKDRRRNGVKVIVRKFSDGTKMSCFAPS